MKLLTSLLLLLIAVPSFAQFNYPSYYDQNKYALTSPSTFKYGLYGFNNPAVLTFVETPDIYFNWSDESGDFNDFNNWGLFTAVPNFGFSVVRTKFNRFSVTDYRLSSSVGNESFSLGLGYGWSGGDKDVFRHYSLYTIGMVIRPNRYLSLGGIGIFPTKGEREGAIDIGIRPLGDEMITLFADYVFTEDKAPERTKWSAGAIVEPLEGIRFSGRYFDSEVFNVGVEFSLGSISFTSTQNYNSDGDNLYGTYGIRIGAYDRNILNELFAARSYAKFNLNESVKYQRFKLFDNSQTLLNILTEIEAAKNDKSVTGIAINLSGLSANRVTLWEIRNALEDFKSSSKKIVIYIDRVGIEQYHFASVADKIIMDPMGTITLEGYLMGRTFMKNTLEKIGIGLNELRYFKYKSAVESFSREEMSRADSLQRYELIEDFYELSKSNICSSRNISREKFDELVNEEYIFLPGAAIEHNLVDDLGRWDEVKDIVKELNGTASFVSAGSLEEFSLPRDNYWGKKPEVAVIYAIGSTSMDDGINARELVKDVEEAVDDDNIKAIVFRVDSPGGDALASDLVAEALKEAKGKKPVIVSQGYVAGSGGYWLSMYGDTIVAAPNTITGSIGVIGAFYYNTKFTQKLGLTSDYVKIGKHADIGFGPTLPLLGLTIPARNLSEEEESRVKNLILQMYEEFVDKVAMGRDMPESEVKEIAEGRVWSGNDALAIGLVDILGGLDNAIDIAVKEAGLNGEEYDIVEFPEQPLFDFGIFLPDFFGFKTKTLEEDPFIHHLKFRLKYNGIPMPILPLEDMSYILENRK